MQSVMRQRFWILEEHHGGEKNLRWSIEGGTLIGRSSREVERHPHG